MHKFAVLLKIHVVFVHVLSYLKSELSSLNTFRPRGGSRGCVNTSV